MEETSKNDEQFYNLTAYLRIIAATSVRGNAAEVIDTWEKAIVYSKMDGSTSQMKIASNLGISQRTVAFWADVFVRHHLALAPSKYNSSHKGLFSLEELGIAADKLKKSYRPKTINSDFKASDDKPKNFKLAP